MRFCIILFGALLVATVGFSATTAVEPKGGIDDRLLNLEPNKRVFIQRMRGELADFFTVTNVAVDLLNKDDAQIDELNKEILANLEKNACQLVTKIYTDYAKELDASLGLDIPKFLKLSDDKTRLIRREDAPQNILGTRPRMIEDAYTIHRDNILDLVNKNDEFIKDGYYIDQAELIRMTYEYIISKIENVIAEYQKHKEKNLLTDCTEKTDEVKEIGASTASRTTSTAGQATSLQPPPSVEVLTPEAPKPGDLNAQPDSGKTEEINPNPADFRVQPAVTEF